MASTGRRFIVNLEKGKETAQLGKVLHVLATLGVSVTAIKMVLTGYGRLFNNCFHSPKYQFLKLPAKLSGQIDLFRMTPRYKSGVLSRGGYARKDVLHVCPDSHGGQAGRGMRDALVFPDLIAYG